MFPEKVRAQGCFPASASGAHSPWLVCSPLYILHTKGRKGNFLMNFCPVPDRLICRVLRPNEEEATVWVVRSCRWVWSWLLLAASRPEYEATHKWAINKHGNKHQIKVPGYGSNTFWENKSSSIFVMHLLALSHLNQKNKLWLQSTCFTTFLLTTRISVDLFLHRNWHYI